MPIDGTVLGNVFGGGSVLQRENFEVSLSLSFFLSLSSFLSLSLFLSPSLFLSLSPFLSLSLSPSLSLSLSCGFCLDRVLVNVTNGFANCNF